QKIIQLNLVAPLVLSTQCAAVMRGQKTVGNIVNIASVSATRPSPGTAAYGAAKAGLLSATRSLAQEWGPNVRVNAIVVGLVHHDAGVEHYGGEEGFKRVANMLPLKRMAQPPDIADACLYLSSGQASYVSGASLEVDGGGEAPVFLYLAGDNK
ncbi:MAG: SDR family oxidoreductase, partial [Pseudomonadales bacterium]